MLCLYENNMKKKTSKKFTYNICRAERSDIYTGHKYCLLINAQLIERKKSKKKKY